MECLMDDNDDSIEETMSEEPNILSRSISGTFQAVPAQVIEQTEMEKQKPMELSIDKLNKERREFCNSMLTENAATKSEHFTDQVKRNKVDLMAEIRSQVQATPADDEVFHFGRAKAASPVVLIDTHIEQGDVFQQSHQNKFIQEFKSEDLVSVQKTEVMHESRQEIFESHQETSFASNLSTQNQRVMNSLQSAQNIEAQSARRVYSIDAPTPVTTPSPVTAPVIKASHVAAPAPFVQKTEVRHESRQETFESHQETSFASNISTQNIGAQSAGRVYSIDAPTPITSPSPVTVPVVKDSQVATPAPVVKASAVPSPVPNSTPSPLTTPTTVVRASPIATIDAPIIIAVTPPPAPTPAPDLASMGAPSPLPPPMVVTSPSLIPMHAQPEIPAAVSPLAVPSPITTPVPPSPRPTKELTQSQSLPRNVTMRQKPTKLKMFEASQREKVFSISGMWNSVRLGLVKERSTFWQPSSINDDNSQTKAPNYMIQKKDNKRNSRVIDPNEWVMPAASIATSIDSETEKEVVLHKSLSVGQLDVVDVEDNVEGMMVSQATVAFEQRANGRKSADIFVHNVKVKKDEVAAVETQVKERLITKKADDILALVEILADKEKVSETLTETSNEKLCENQDNNSESLGSSNPPPPELAPELPLASLIIENDAASPTPPPLPSPPPPTKKLPQIPPEATLPPPVPEVPHRNSSKLAVKKKMLVHSKATTNPVAPATPAAPPPPILQIVNMETSSVNGDRVQELERLDEEKRLQDEAGKRSKIVQEQEKKFYEKLEISENYQRRQAQQQATQDYAPTPPPPPKVNYDKPNKANQQRLEKLKVQELKERMKLKEMERRKRQIEEEIAREKKHLASLIHLEKESSPLTNAKNEAAELVSSPPPPPVPPRPFNHAKSRPPPAAPIQPQQQSSEELQPNHGKSRSTNQVHLLVEEPQFISLDDTVKDLEKTTLELKNMAQKRAADNDEAIRQTAGAVREVAQVLLDAAIHSDDDTEGYSEGAEDFSCGIEMPFSMAGGGTELDSGNVTPVQTLGELEDISVEELELQSSTSPRRTPLKSLLKKSFETEETPEEPLTTVRERSCSPRKAVHFSKVDQVKCMSQESLVSTAPSDGSQSEAQTVNATSMTCTAKPAPKENGDAGAPRRNQLVS